MAEDTLASKQIVDFLRARSRPPCVSLFSSEFGALLEDCAEMLDAALTSEPLADLPAQIAVTPRNSLVRDETVATGFYPLLS
jgi:hypothetical protein